MTQPASPPFSGKPVPVQGVTGGPSVFGGQIGNDPATGNVVITPNPGNVVQFRKGNTPQALQIYENFTDNNNYTRLGFYAQTGGPFLIQDEFNGSGGPRDLSIQSNQQLLLGGQQNLQLQTGGVTRWAVNNLGILLPQTDATLDIGSPSNRVNNIYVANPIHVQAPYTQVGLAASQAIPNNASTALVWAGFVANLPAYYNAAGSTGITVTLQGIYTFTVSIIWQGNVGGTRRELSLALNGATFPGYFASGPLSGGAAVGISISNVRTVPAATSLTAQVFQDSGATINIVAASMTIARIGDA